MKKQPPKSDLDTMKELNKQNKIGGKTGNTSELSRISKVRASKPERGKGG